MSPVGLVDILGLPAIPVLEKYRVNSVYLFGSQIDGTADADSDYDLGILLQEYDPTQHNSLFASTLEAELQALTTVELDVLLLDQAPIILRFTVIKEGKLIYCIDDDYRTDFEELVIRDYLDFKPFLDTYYREMRDAIKEGDFCAAR